MKILVTGGAGFIGSHIADACVQAGHEVIVVDDLSSGRVENVNEGARLERMDIRSPEAAQLIMDERPDLIDHHAAQMNVRRSVDDPGFDAEVNVLGFVNLLEAARNAGCRRVVFASSGGAVYGEPERFPTDETEPLRPICPYGVSKLAGEQYLFYYQRVHGLRYVALRYANVYGPRQDPHGEAGVVAIFSQRLLGGQGVLINDDGLQTRDYVFVGDVVAANLAAFSSDYTGAVNIGTGVETSVVALYESIKAQVGAGGTAEHGPAKGGEIRRSALDASRAERELGWRPGVSLDEGLGRTVEYFSSRV